MLPLGMVLGVASGALESRERFLTSNVLQATGTILGQVLPLGCAWLFGPTLDVVIPALLIARLLSVLMSFGADNFSRPSAIPATLVASCSLSP